MMRKNPFDGKGVYPKFVKFIYMRLMSREWFSHADVMAEKVGRECVETRGSVENVTR